MNKNYIPLKSRLRASFAAGLTNEPRLEKVDRENNCLYGVQITLEGEALGHDVWLDREFCQAVVDAGNETGDAGVKVRFGHPSMCSDALGTYLGRAKNFRLVDLTRKDGTAAAGVLADVYLDPNADRTEWVLNMSDSAPDTFGQSIVFTYADMKYVDADGVWHKLSEDGANEQNAADGKLYAILGKLHGTDFTDTPAATDGVFSADDLAAEATEMLETHPALAKVSGKSVVEFLKRTGREDVLEAFENARVAGLQKHEAELKDEWQTKMTALAQERDELAAKNLDLQERSVKAVADLEAKLDEVTKDRDAFASANESLNADLTMAKGSLSEAQAKLDALTATLKEKDDALASQSAALELSQERYRAVVGKALQPGDGVRTYAQIVSDRTAKPEEKLAAARAEVRARRARKN